MSLASLGNAVVFAVVAIALFAVTIAFLARVLPGNLWRQATEANSLAAAVIMAAVTLALGWIIAAAFH
jgi:uncharacterized membrane protein YjfL (UPF0719 family)